MMRDNGVLAWLRGKSGDEDAPQAEQQALVLGYDYSTRERREETAGRLFAKARDARTAKESEWVRLNDYYNFLHAVSDEVRQAVRESDLDWDPAVVPDPFIMVESQIDPVVPEPEFRGRDDDQDSAKAKQREYAVRYVCQSNRLEELNTANERRLKKLGDAFWKVYWDDEMPCGPYQGDIHIRDVPVEALYVDPAAGPDGIQAGQFVAYVYRLHKVRFWQLFQAELTGQGLTTEDIMSSEYTPRGGLFDLVTPNVEDDEDTIQVMEFWFKHPQDDPETGASAGDIGCTIQAGGHEVRYIPRYWQRTGAQNRQFPFVHYWCIRNENEFYNKSELLPILPLVDAADRELANGLMNDAFTANDIILQEEGALADGEEFTNVPGAVVKLRQNGIGRVARLGVLNDGKNCLGMVEWLLNQIQRTNRNYETNQGKASSTVKTATELAMLRSDVDAQMEIKKADRNAGFVRLYELIDWSALEFYDDDRVIFLGAEKPGEDAVNFRFQTDNYAVQVPAVHDPMTMETLREPYTYWPTVDVTVNAGDGVIRSKAATLQALQNLAGVPVTAENYKLLTAMLDVLDIPQKQEITQEWQDRFAPKVPPLVLAALETDPELLGQVTQAVQAKQVLAQLQQQSTPAGMPPAPATVQGGGPTAAQFDLMGGGVGVVPQM